MTHQPLTTNVNPTTLRSTESTFAPGLQAAATALTAMQAVLAATVLALCPPAQAQPVQQEPAGMAQGLSGRIGLSMASVPTYEGSPNRRTVVGPDLTLRYRSHGWGSVEFGQRGLIWNAVEAGPFRFALVAQLDPGRKDKDPQDLDPSPGDKRLTGLGRVQDSTEAGVGVGYGPVMLVVRQSLGDRGHRGAQADLSADFPWAVSDRLHLSVSVGATWADQKYMQTYFGVTAAQSRASSFSVYTPRSGVRKLDASVGAEYALTSSWKLQANLALSRLMNDAAASPLVGSRHGASAALGLAYAF